MFKKVTVGLLVVLVCLTMASVVSFAQTKTITMYHAFTANTLLALRNLINDFQKEYPNIRVRAEYVGDALNQKIQAAVTAGNPPDLACSTVESILSTPELAPSSISPSGSSMVLTA